MKKLIVSLLLVASVAAMYAQQRNVNRARNIARSENPNFAAARELIAPALQDESTKNLANTWFIAGEIGHRENQRLEAMRYLNPAAFDQGRQGQVVMESLNYFIVADSLDQLPDDRGRVRPRHRRDIRRMVTEYYQHGSLIAYGAYLFDRSDFVGAFNVFNTFLSIPDLPLMENSIQKDSTFYQIMFFTAVSASNAEKPHEAIRLFEQLTTKDYEPMAVFQLLFDEYRRLNDTINLVGVLQRGIERFPGDNLWFLENLINHYIYSGQNEIALEYVEAAILSSPTFAPYHNIKGALLEQLGYEEKAEAAFKRALELDPDLTLTLDALGRMHMRRGVAIGEGVFATRDAELQRREQEKANAEFRLALPFFERLVELEPDIEIHRRLLLNLYWRLGMDAEYEAASRGMGTGE